MLPTIALCSAKRIKIRYLMIGLLALVVGIAKSLDIMYVIVFLCGIAAAILAEFPMFLRIAAHRISSLVALTCLCLLFIDPISSFQLPPLVLLAITFSIVANGNSFFGVLTAPVSRILGKATYSFYLQHQIILYVVFTLVIGTDAAKNLTPAEHWAIIFALIPIALMWSLATYKLIELPGIKAGQIVHQFLTRKSR